MKTQSAAPIELELKYALTPSDYRKLLAILHAKKQRPIRQVNHYFDTPTLLLRRKRIGLRIRISGGSQAELTLKFPKPLTEKHPAAFKSRYEYESQIPLKLAKCAIKGKLKLTEFDVEAIAILKSKVAIRGLKQLRYLGCMKNQRTKIRHRGFVFELDHFSFFGKTLFELEIETAEPQAADKAYRELCSKHHILYHPSPHSKLFRFLEAWKGHKKRLKDHP